MGKGPTPRPLLQRFFEKVIVTEDCWLWIGAKNSFGYGSFGVFGTKTVLAHRLSYEIHRGFIPKGYELDHTCRTRNCINPWHLDVVTHYENIMRGEGLAPRYKRRAVCHKGHQFHVNQDGRRRCKECQRASDRLRRKNNTTNLQEAFKDGNTLRRDVYRT